MDPLTGIGKLSPLPERAKTLRRMGHRALGTVSTGE